MGSGAGGVADRVVGGGDAPGRYTLQAVRCCEMWIAFWMKF